MGYYPQSCMTIVRGTEIHKGLFIQEQCFAYIPSDGETITLEFLDARRSVKLTKQMTVSDMNMDDFIIDIELTPSETASLDVGIGYFRVRLDDLEIVPITTMYVV